ncbi:MAG: hypothetical protein ABIJ82_04050 [Patescibacteria group bacterium]
MSNVPVQVINSLLEDKKSEASPTSGTRVPEWLEETSLEKEDAVVKAGEPPNTERVESISGEPIETVPQEEMVETLISDQKPQAGVVNKLVQGELVKTIALETTDTLTNEADEIEQKEFITGVVTAHGGTK